MESRHFLQHLNLTSRILFSFWLTLILVLLAGIILIFNSREDFDSDKFMPPIKLGNELSIKMMTHDMEEVKEWFKQQAKDDVRRMFIVYKGKELLDRPLPWPLQKIEKRISVQHPFKHVHKGKHVAVGRVMLLPNGEHVKILVRARDPHPPWREIILDNLIIFCLVSILISGLISYVLARYISKPVRVLRNATKQLAAGELSTRVLPTMQARRDELYLLAQDFDHMAEQLDRAVASQKRMIQDISHELRSPVARLQIAVELAKKRLHIEQNQEFDRIENECVQINNIITTLLNLPAYELDPGLALTDKVDIGILLESLCDDMNYMSQLAHIELNNALDDSIVLSANGQLLRSALENVLKNAQHYTDPKDSIKLSVSNTHNDVSIECCDQGPGVPENKIQEIFKPFYRLSEARDRSSGGYGLGLAIAKRAVEIHSGSISAINQTDKGLCVCIRLPIKHS